MYKIFNDFTFASDNQSPNSENYRFNLYSGSECQNICPPAKSVSALSDVVLRAFAGPVGSYINCEQFASALGAARQTLTPAVLDAVIIEPRARAQSPDNASNGANTVTVPNAKRKSSKGLLIGIISAGATLLIGLIVLLIVFFMPGNKDDDVIDNTAVVAAEFMDSELTVIVGDTYYPEIFFDNIMAHELVFESSDTDVVTVRNDSPENSVTTSTDPDAEYNIVIQAIGEGSATITVLDTEGNELGELYVTVEPAPYVDKISVGYIEQILSNAPEADYGVYVIDVAEDHEYIFSNSYDILGSSALVCLPILYTYGKEMDAGYSHADTPIYFEYSYANSRGIYKPSDDGKTVAASQLMSSMLRYSDNNCINSLIEYLSLDTIESTMVDAGMTGTNVVRKLDPNPADNRENQISAYDAGQMLYKMVTDEVSPGRSFIMSNFRISDGEEVMGEVIPDDAMFLNHNAVTSSKFNEIIYVESGDAKFIISFISNNSNVERSKAVAKDIAKYVYESFTN